MTREEEIKYASKDYVNYLLDKQDYHNENYTEDDIKQSFGNGAEWADNHSINVWHDTSEEPNIGSNIVAIDKDEQWWDIQPYNNDYDEYVLNGWECCILVYNSIQKWSYIDDLLPKGVLK